jgi:lambda family phage portal protein
MKVSTRIYNWLTGTKPEPKRRARRSYGAANANRLNSGWTVVPTTANYEIRTSLAALQGRSRELFRDNAYFKKYAAMVQNNVIGPKGIKLQCTATKLDGQLNTKLNTKVEEAFEDWGHRETCTASGKLNWKAVQRLVARTLPRDGEVLIQKIQAQNKYGFSLKFWDVTYLDPTFNDTRPGGNRVIMSVEIDADYRPVAYWLTTPASDINFANRSRTRQRVRVPAEQMIYVGIGEESQVRCVPWVHAVTVDAKNIDEYDLGVITSAKMTAMSGGFFKKSENDGLPAFTGGEDGEGDELAPEIEMSPASFTTLPDGYEFQQFDPKQPTQNHAAFKKTVVMKLAIGLDVFYFSLSGDMEAVNFSSARLGLGEEHDMWRVVQEIIVTQFCREVYHEWVRSAFLSGALDLTAREFQQVQNPSWRPRGWQYFDPTKEIAANVQGLKNKLLRLRDVIEENGGDFEEHLRGIAADEAFAKSIGLELAYDESTTAPPPPDTAGEPAKDKSKSAAAA